MERNFSAFVKTEHSSEELLNHITGQLNPIQTFYNYAVNISNVLLPTIIAANILYAFFQPNRFIAILSIKLTTLGMRSQQTAQFITAKRSFVLGLMNHACHLRKYSLQVPKKIINKLKGCRKTRSRPNLRHSQTSAVTACIRAET
jgi:hypothetical protein